MSEVTSWVPVLVCMAGIFFSAKTFEMHSRVNIASAAGIILLCLTSMYSVYCLQRKNSLNVNGVSIVFLVWLIRGPIISTIPTIFESTISSTMEFLFSTWLIVTTMTTFADPQRILVVWQVRWAIQICYFALLLLPHGCSSSLAYDGLEMSIRTLLFLGIWFVSDYAFVVQREPSTMQAKWWWATFTKNSDYRLLMFRSIWVLFVPTLFLLAGPLVVTFSLLEITMDQRRRNDKPKDDDPESALPHSSTPDSVHNKHTQHQLHLVHSPPHPKQPRRHVHEPLNNQRHVGELGDHFVGSQSTSITSPVTSATMVTEQRLPSHQNESSQPRGIMSGDDFSLISLDSASVGAVRVTSVTELPMLPHQDTLLTLQGGDDQSVDEIQRAGTHLSQSNDSNESITHGNHVGLGETFEPENFLGALTDDKRTPYQVPVLESTSVLEADFSPQTADTTETPKSTTRSLPLWAQTGGDDEFL